MSHLPKFTRHATYKIAVDKPTGTVTLSRVTAKSAHDALRLFRSQGGYRAAMRDGYPPKMITAREV